MRCRPFLQKNPKLLTICPSFHIDFGGTSVFYHLLSGEKVFYFIEPTPRNLRKYEKWASRDSQLTSFLGNEVDLVHRVHLTAGNTMFIPSGWIHAVYTPQDALVIGGNFLHSLSTEMQITIYDMETRLGTEQKFRFPLFEKCLWYAAGKVLVKLIRAYCPFLRFHVCKSNIDR